MPPSRASANELARLLEAVAQPVYFVSDERRIIFCNQACRDWTGLAGEELLGRECRYHSSPELEGAAAIAAALCPPPEAFHGRRMRGNIILPASSSGDSGSQGRRAVEFVPLGEGLASSAVLAMVAAADSPIEPEPVGLAPEGSAELHSRLQLHRRRLALRYHVDRLWGDSPAMRQVRAQVRMATGAMGNVVIFGPAGSGRDHVARAIHYAAGPDKAGTLVPLACPLLDAELLQAALRGLAKSGSKPPAQTAALLLDDVDQLPVQAQVELAEALRAASPPRIFSTASEPLAEVAARGAFPHDLACLLSTLSIRLPPLAERIEDVPLVAQWFVEQANSRGGKQVSGFSAESLDRLAGYHWLGDVAELEAMVAEVHANCEGDEITPRDLPPRVAWAAEATARPRKIEETIVLEEFLARIERELIERALAQARGNKTKAARWLGMTRPRFYRRLVQLGFDVGDEEESDQ